MILGVVLTDFDAEKRSEISEAHFPAGSFPGVKALLIVCSCSGLSRNTVPGQIWCSGVPIAPGTRLRAFRAFCMHRCRGKHKASTPARAVANDRESISCTLAR